MLKIRTHKQFDKNYHKRIIPFPKLNQKFQKRLQVFISNPKNPSLKDHQLIGKMGKYRSFSVTGDIRVVYIIENSTIILFDIGSHNQVY